MSAKSASAIAATMATITAALPLRRRHNPTPMVALASLGFAAEPHPRRRQIEKRIFY